jgi:hypothetical protein
MSVSISLAFKKLPDAKMVVFANTIFQRMSEDAKYVSLKSYYDAVKTANEAFSLAISNAALGGTDRRDAKNDAKEVVIKALVSITRRLEEMAENDNDNTRIVTDAGFEVRSYEKKSKEPITVLETPILSAKNIENRDNAATIMWPLVPNAINYAIRHKKITDTEWQNGNYNNTGEFTFPNLEGGNVYMFQICAQGDNGLMSNWATSLPVYVS